MRFFDMLSTQHLVLGVFFGLIAALLVSIGFGGSRSKNRPLPTVVLFLFIGFAVWFVCYVIFWGLKGGPL
jgi:H+/Cl- antiporter ClcA